jgi:hypothetical protein
VKRKGWPCTPEAVELYQRFYWNIELVDSTELKAIIQLRVAPQPTTDPDESAQGSALLKAHYSDPRRVAAGISISPLAGIMNQMRMGLMPSNVELAKLASAARVAATIKVLESLYGNSAERGRDYALIAKVMSEMLESVGSPEEELQENLKSLTLHTESAPVIHINQLSAGQHTVDIQPIGETKNADVK